MCNNVMYNDSAVLKSLQRQMNNLIYSAVKAMVYKS